jgi:hypothetical protein
MKRHFTPKVVLLVNSANRTTLVISIKGPEQGPFLL